MDKYTDSFSWATAIQRKVEMWSGRYDWYDLDAKGEKRLISKLKSLVKKAIFLVCGPANLTALNWAANLKG